MSAYYEYVPDSYSRFRRTDKHTVLHEKNIKYGNVVEASWGATLAKMTRDRSGRESFLMEGRSHEEKGAVMQKEELSKPKAQEDL